MILLDKQAEFTSQNGTIVRFSYEPQDRSAGRLCLEIILPHDETAPLMTVVASLSPWDGVGWEVEEWTTDAASILVITGAERIVLVDLAACAITGAISFEYEEAETLDRPWIVRWDAQRALIVATERRVFCIDDRPSIRWVWSANTSDINEFIVRTPTVSKHAVHVPISTRGSERITTLDAAVGNARPGWDEG